MIINNLQNFGVIKKASTAYTLKRVDTLTNYSLGYFKLQIIKIHNKFGTILEQSAPNHFISRAYYGKGEI